MTPPPTSYADLAHDVAARLEEVERALAAWGARADEEHVAQCAAVLQRARRVLARCDAPPRALVRSLDELHCANTTLLIDAAAVGFRLESGRGAPATKARDPRGMSPRRAVADLAPDLDEPDWEILPSR